MQQLSRLTGRPSRSPRCLPDSSKTDKYDLASANTYKKYLVGFEEPTTSRQTRRKKYQPQGSFSQALIEKNKKLTDENAELYRLLEERGKIILVLEKKIQAQAAKRGIEESAIRNRGSGRHQLKLAQYEELIPKLKRQIQQLKGQNKGGKSHLLGQFDSFKGSADREKLTYQRDLQTDLVQLSRQEDESKHLKALLNIKTLQLQELSLVYRTEISSQKAQISTLKTQLADLSQQHKSELLEIRMSYEHRLQNCSRQHIHQMEVIALQHSLEVKQLVNIAEAKKEELQRLKSATMTDKVEVDRKYEQLINNNDKLQVKIEEVQEYYKQYVQDEVEKVKQLHRSELAGLIANKDAIAQRLEAAVRKQKDISAAKSLQIEALNIKVNELTAYAGKEDQKSKTIIEGLKAQISRLQLSQFQISRREKIKLEELKDADITALKDFYEHQIQMLNGYLHEQIQLNHNQKNSLYHEIDQKAEMRRHFDMEIEVLSLRIKQLEANLGSLSLQRKTQVEQMNQRLQIATEIHQKYNEGKDKSDLIAENQVKQLQRLIIAKDNQIQELNKKIVIIKQNHANQISQKDNDIVRIKRQCQQMETRSKKQKYVFENELKKREATIKNNKSIYDGQVQRLKANHGIECQAISKQLEEAKSKWESQLLQLKNSEKKLKRQLEYLLQSKQTDIQGARSELVQQTERLQTEKKELEQRRVSEHNKQKKQLENEIGQLKKKLGYKEEDLRNINDRYYRLEQKLAMVLDSQEKLKNIENKMNILGQENNYVKQLASVIKHKKQP